MAPKAPASDSEYEEGGSQRLNVGNGDVGDAFAPGPSKAAKGKGKAAVISNDQGKPGNSKASKPRKERAPRGKLLRWSENDWKQAVLGIVHACGEADVKIPFEEAAKVISPTCTAGAFQQAILKLQKGQAAEGFYAPDLHMAWAKSKDDLPSNALRHRLNRNNRRRTRDQGAQVLLTRLRVAMQSGSENGSTQVSSASSSTNTTNDQTAQTDNEPFNMPPALGMYSNLPQPQFGTADLALNGFDTDFANSMSGSAGPYNAAGNLGFGTGLAGGFQNTFSFADGNQLGNPFNIGDVNSQVLPSAFPTSSPSSMGDMNNMLGATNVDALPGAFQFDANLPFGDNLQFDEDFQFDESNLIFDDTFPWPVDPMDPIFQEDFLSLDPHYPAQVQQEDSSVQVERDDSNHHVQDDTHKAEDDLDVNFESFVSF